MTSTESSEKLDARGMRTIPVMLSRHTITNMLYGGGKPEDHTILTQAFRDALNADEGCVGDNPAQEEED